MEQLIIKIKHQLILLYLFNKIVGREITQFEFLKLIIKYPNYTFIVTSGKTPLYVSFDTKTGNLKLIHKVWDISNKRVDNHYDRCLHYIYSNLNNIIIGDIKPFIVESID